MNSVTQSPDMKCARNRLEDLLSSMKKNVPTPNKHSSDHDESDSHGSWNVLGKHLRTPKKEPEEPAQKVSRAGGKKILFELRQKPFELPSTTIDYSLYELCRIWLRGKEESSSRPSSDEPTTSSKSTNKSVPAAKIIDKMPPVTVDASRKNGPLENEPSTRSERLQEIQSDTSRSKEEILASYLPRWKAVKKNTNRRSNEWAEKVCGANLKVLQEAFVPVVQNLQPQ